MFGDLFYQRTENESGLMYSSRRRFLSSGRNVFEPPVEFQTRKQAQRRHMQSLDSTLSISQVDDDESLESIAKDSKDERFPHAKRKESIAIGMVYQQQKRSSFDEQYAGKKFKKTAKFIMDAVMFEHEIKEEKWTEETAAGVQYWVNKETGDVVTECPWPHASPTKSKRAFHRVTVSGKIKNKFMKSTNDVEETEDEMPEGTGSLVFQPGRDVDELFKLLDAAK